MRYHHYIPRFIPEDTSCPEPSIRKTKKQRQREARKARKKGQPNPETISVFNLGSRLIESVPIATTFGVMSFYEDASNQEDLEHLEKKLSELEGKAARVIRELHVAAGRQSSDQTFTLPRSDLQLLRKFIFLMHYRSSAVEKTYFQEDHPRNAPIRQWIRHLKKTKGYTTDKEIWLDGLHYYLTTKHSDILNHAKQCPEYGPSQPVGETDVDIPSHQWHALAYESFANNYYLGISSAFFVRPARKAYHHLVLKRTSSAVKLRISPTSIPVSIVNMPFHHYLPQFVLRGFIPEDTACPEPSVQKTKEQSQRETRKPRKNGQSDSETVLAFKMESKSIESVPIATAFGVMNFYQDLSSREDLKRLSELEGEAARIIRELHIAAGRQSSNQTFTLPRSDLKLLRKFIFLMHYRSSAPERTYYQENHPRNALIRQWIRHLKITKGYTTNREIWLDGLHYYLSTKHSDILNHAKQCSNYEPIDLIGETNVDIPSYQWHALAYESFNNNNYLGIWKSHEDSEFVLGNNCYGVWEGTLAGSPLLYKIYVVSPKITIVLKLNMSKTLPSELEDSTLSGHPLGFPQTVYHRGPGALGNILASSKDQVEALQRHLKSPDSDNDQFTFRINQLTVGQTYLVNQVVLENLDHDGLLVFASRHALLSTAQRYDSPEGPFWKQNRGAIAELVRCLKSGASGTLTSSIFEPGASTPGLGNSTSPNPAFVRRFRARLGFGPPTKGEETNQTGTIKVKDGESMEGGTKSLELTNLSGVVYMLSVPLINSH
ncbi:hypothetical protein H1R20_g13225, partial [Candolleomyces eurysporus]